jgi:hypothetical protein
MENLDSDLVHYGEVEGHGMKEA